MFFKFFIPIVWTSFFGALMISIFLHSGMNRAIRSYSEWLPYGFLALFLLVIVSFYKTIWQLKRVEVDEYFIYVSDYFKTARYPYHQIDNIRETQFLGLSLVDILLKNKGIFGKKIFFLGRPSTLNAIYNLKDASRNAEN